MNDSLFDVIFYTFNAKVSFDDILKNKCIQDNRLQVVENKISKTLNKAQRELFEDYKYYQRRCQYNFDIELIKYTIEYIYKLDNSD